MTSQALILKAWLLATLLLGFSFAVQAQPKSEKSKIEELFIWKISDELKLSTKEEKSFSDLFRDLNQKKMILGHSQDETINQLASVTKDKDRTRFLGDYRKQMQEYDKIQVREFDEMKKLLGPERLAKYIAIKRDLTNKVKTLLTEKSEKKETELPPPKVIEE